MNSLLLKVSICTDHHSLTMQRQLQNKTYFAHTGHRKSKLRAKYNQSSFDIEHNDSGLGPPMLKEPRTPLDVPQYLEPNDNNKNKKTIPVANNEKSDEKSSNRANKMNAFIELHSPRKVVTASSRKNSSQMSPAHTSYKTPLYNIVLDERESAVKNKRLSAQNIQLQ